MGPICCCREKLVVGDSLSRAQPPADRQCHLEASEAAGEAADQGVPSSHEDLQLKVHGLSGQVLPLNTSKSASPERVCASIEQLLGIPAGCQQWLHDEEEIFFLTAATMAETGLECGDQLMVLHVGAVPLAPLPKMFHLELLTVRMHGRPGCSSAFTMKYNIYGNVTDNWMRFEPWRKNDHDLLLYDVEADTLRQRQSHWMAGSSCSTRSLEGQDPLRELCQAWSTPAKWVREDSERFWLVGDQDPPKQERDITGVRKEADQQRPNYFAIDGWFRSPSEDAREIEVDVPLPGQRESSKNKRIIRLLLDSNGNPIMAAVKGCAMGHLHEDIEEYSVTLKAMSEMSKPAISE